MSHIVVVGSGVVGAATGKGFIKKGHRVTFVDVIDATLEKLRAEKLDARKLDAVDWDSADFVMLTVPTPTRDEQISLEYIKQAAVDIGAQLKTTNRFVVVVVRSTVPPQTTEHVVAPLLEQHSGKRAGVDFGVAMNPEFLRQAVAVQDFAKPWITVIGTNDARTQSLLEALYKPFGALVATVSPTEAEMIKYVNNIYNAVKISYFNEVHAISKKLGIDADVVGAVVARSAESMWNPLYGTKGGVPYGGACLPKDTKAFSAWAHSMGFDHLMLDATMDVNALLESKVAAVANPADLEQVRAEAEAKAHADTEPQQRTAHTQFAVAAIATNGKHAEVKAV
jgi:UDPglucose 6-dehydrogenase